MQNPTFPVSFVVMVTFIYKWWSILFFWVWPPLLETVSYFNVTVCSVSLLWYLHPSWWQWYLYYLGNTNLCQKFANHLWLVSYLLIPKKVVIFLFIATSWLLWRPLGIPCNGYLIYKHFAIPWAKLSYTKIWW